jgi:RNA polymerase sigma-70 factor (ECF subfamily)
MPFFLWLRFLTGQRLQLVHRQHPGAQMRDAGREVLLHRGAMPQATSVSLAAQLLGRFTSVTRAVQRAEMQPHNVSWRPAKAGDAEWMSG